MYKYIFLLAVNSIFCQTLVLKNEYKIAVPGGLSSFAVVNDASAGRAYLLVREMADERRSLSIYDKDLKRLASVPVSGALEINDAFIHDGKLFFADDRLKYLNLADYSVYTVNKDRQKIHSFYMTKFHKSDVILADNSQSIFLYEYPSFRELLNIRRAGLENNFIISLLSGKYIYFTSRTDEITCFDIDANKSIWSVKLPEKPIKFIGIKLTSLPNWITGIIPYTRKNRECIGLFSGAGDYFCLDAATGKVLQEDKEFDTFDDLEQNNKRLCTSAAIFRTGPDNTPVFYAGAVDKNVYCINAENAKDIWITDTGNELQFPLSYADINNDSYPEVFGVNDYDNTLFILDGKTGKKILSQKVKYGDTFNQTRVYLADFYGTGTLNLILKVNNQAVRIYELQPQVKVPAGFLYKFKK